MHTAAPVTTPTPTAPPAAAFAVTVAPVAASITTAQSLGVNVKVTSTQSGITPNGSIVLTSGAYASFPVAVTAGAASVTIPAGLLAIGSDTLSARFTPSGGSTSAATGSAGVTVAATTTMPSVSASSTTYATAGNPFSVLPTSSGKIFVSISGSTPGVQVFSPGAGGFTSSCIQPYSSSLAAQTSAALTLRALPNGTNYALAAGDAGLDFLNASALATCTATDAVVSQGTAAMGEGTFTETFTADGRYAFVGNEYGIAPGASFEGNVGVVALAYDGSGNVSTSSRLVGEISTGGQAIAGVTLSPDGTRLYVTSEISHDANAAGAGNPILQRSACIQDPARQPAVNGLLSVIDVAKAEAAPGPSAIISTVDAGCSPVRTVETSDGSTLWLAARGDNRVLAFSTGMLESNPGAALLGSVNTGGIAPVGLQFFHGQSLLAIANSNRFSTAVGNVGFVSTVAVAPTLAGTTPAGYFPREFSVGADDATLYLSNFNQHDVSGGSTFQVITTSASGVAPAARAPGTQRLR